MLVEVRAQRRGYDRRQRLFGLDSEMLDLANEIARQIDVELLDVFVAHQVKLAC